MPSIIHLRCLKRLLILEKIELRSTYISEMRNKGNILRISYCYMYNKESALNVSYFYLCKKGHFLPVIIAREVWDRIPKVSYICPSKIKENRHNSKKVFINRENEHLHKHSSCDRCRIFVRDSILLKLITKTLNVRRRIYLFKASVAVSWEKFRKFSAGCRWSFFQPP